jgi:hypothetical protein
MIKAELFSEAPRLNNQGADYLNQENNKALIRQDH